MIDEDDLAPDVSCDDEGKRVESLGDRPAGDDPANPYQDVDIANLPSWWREAIEEYNRYGLRPYRPPVFSDGTLKRKVIQSLESELNVEIQLVNPDIGEDDWEIRLDGEVVGRINRFRDPDGFSVFEIASDEFASLVRTAQGKSQD